MRISQAEQDLFKKLILEILPEAQVYLYGSRTDDSLKGGDIDILILASRVITLKEKSSIYWGFCEVHGEQKIDIVSFKFNSDDSFLKVILPTAVKL